MNGETLGNPQWKKKRSWIQYRTKLWMVVGSAENLAITTWTLTGCKNTRKLLTRNDKSTFCCREEQRWKTWFARRSNQKVQMRYVKLCPKCGSQVMPEKPLLRNTNARTVVPKPQPSEETKFLTPRKHYAENSANLPAEPQRRNRQNFQGVEGELK